MAEQRECRDCGRVDHNGTFRECDEGHILCEDCWPEHTGEAA